MATKRPALTKNKRVKAVARERVGSPKPARAIEERTKREHPKHKKNWRQEGEA